MTEAADPFRSSPPDGRDERARLRPAIAERLR